ncbi:MAG: hybrid sensor histidine kinase/response regulator [Oscillatoriophycideae cyanobacterium NC_groundwater_1537_Pr4_S-0.65um_50_18]|nr:hybrid sensor histidine kinase/response regulator [Oscillatoriophycideae cyanobacterium NC_groundwater_1537_Pr4_S-0.65um_50_18]
MTLDPTIREQTYPYFLQEVPELLQALEQGLLSLRETCTLNQVNTLMRATHTLKGAAASVGLETITIIAHSLEDIFKALCRPDISVNPDIQALLFEGFECLRLPLTAELTGGSINDAEILDRATAVFAQLQEELGDCFGQEAYIPTSAELGFDVTQSIFEVGVTQRLDQLAALIADAPLEEITTTLQTQAGIFLGLAESLNLPGFGAIAQATIAALEQHPGQVRSLAEIALADFEAGKAAILAGDRTQGGFPSEALQLLAGSQAAMQQTIMQPTFSEEPEQPEAQNLFLESIWGDTVNAADLALDAELVLYPTSERLEEERLEEERQEESRQEALPENHIFQPPAPQPAASVSNVLRDAASPLPTVRVNVEHLERLSYSMGELLTHQNYQFLQTEQLQASVQNLITRLQQHQQLLSQFQDQFNRQMQRSQPAGKSRKTDNQARKKKRHLQALSFIGQRQPYDALTVQPLLDSAVQLAEAVDAIDLFTHQAHQTLETQQRTLKTARDAVIEARMLPVGQIFGRFSQVLHQLGTRHNKQVALVLQGSEILVDKVVAEKLYDPLLHLVRNAFDHGIESVTARQQRNKPEQGQIEICAYHQGRYLMIEVRDDGEGLDFELIRQRAAERQLVPPHQIRQLTQAQLTNLLFEPGFSTAAQVNNLSGRGVGLDIVRNQLQGLQGSVIVHSQLYQGTTFTLQIPLSLAIAKLFICQADNKTHALFTDAIEQILIPQAEQIQHQYGVTVLRWGKEGNEQQIPLYTLSDLLIYSSTLQLPMLKSSSDSKQKAKSVILMRYQGALIGLEVDQIIGEQELVIRPLGPVIGSPHYVYGASTLASDQLTLVIDPVALIQQVLALQSRGQQRSPAIPLQLSSPAQPQLAASLPPANVDFDANSSPRILTVEDSITVRQGLLLTLQRAGYQVFQAKDGQEAIESLHNQLNVHLIICDLDMPRINGFEFLRYCQRIPELAEIPVIILTSRSDEKHRLLASQLGAIAYMTKPYLEYKLLQLVEEVLERRAVLNKS